MTRTDAAQALARRMIENRDAVPSEQLVAEVLRLTSMGTLREAGAILGVGHETVRRAACGKAMTKKTIARLESGLRSIHRWPPRPLP